MCKVIIVDDDMILREDLKLLISWEQYGFELVGQAADGLKARELMDGFNGVDILITDICMPHEDGIELIRKTLIKYPDTKCLVISNFDDFKYVKEALVLGASNYILKFEIEKDNFLDLLLLTKRQIAEERIRQLEASRKNELSKLGEEQLIDSFWKKCFCGNTDSSIILQEAKQLNINIMECNYCMILVKNFSEDKESKRYLIKRLYSLKDAYGDCEEVFCGSYILEIEPSVFIILYKSTCNSTILIFNAIYYIANNICSKLISNEQINLVLAINEFSIPYSKLSGTLREMERIIESSFYNNKNRILTIRDSVIFTTKLDERLLGRAMNNIINSMLDKQTDYCMDELKKLFDLMNERHYSLNLVFQFMNDIITRMKFVLLETEIELDADMSILNPNKLYNISMLYEHMQCLIKRVIKKQEESLFNMNVRIEIRKAIEYIYENYQLNITLEEVANHVGLSKNHFCRLFKNELKDNFVAYINKFRIQKAKFLMKHTNQKIKEIAVNVGLSDYRYFCKIFKEIEQITPTDYKKYLENNISQYDLAQYKLAKSNGV